MDESIQIIDSHVHVWDLSRQRLPWLADTDGTITHTYELDELASLYDRIPGVEFLGAVYVEVDSDDAEQESRIRLQDPDPRFLAHMMRARMSPYMSAPLASAGIREPLHVPSSQRGRCLEPEFISGLRVLAARGLAFESCNRVEELGDLYEALAQSPQTTVILNHLGNVATLNRGYVADMRRLATLPNLYVKVSGFPTADASFVDELLSFARETFSPERLLFASNWPVVNLYSSLEEHVRTCVEAFGADELFFRDNAIRAYGLAAEAQKTH